MLFFTFIFCRIEVCIFLLSHNADPTIVNCHSKSAIDVAPTQDLKEKLFCEFFILLV